MWMVLLAVISLIIMNNIEQYHRNRPRADVAEIGAEKIENGYLWWNCGDFYDNENWLILDYVGPIYYVTVTQKGKDGPFHLTILDEPPTEPINYVECDGEKDVELEIDILCDQYTMLGDVVIDDRYDELMQLKDIKVKKMRKLKEQLESVPRKY